MMKSTKPIIALLVVVVTLCAFRASAQSRQTSEEYINRYKHIAIDHMERYGIPASITLAQGILESDSGNSNLARRSNNHFGIKCKSDWKGKRVYHTDDAPDESFRKYDSVEESYEDHAEFLDQSPRYDSLFAYSSSDYHSWARGLKAAGYATAPDYAQRLTRIIENYKLYLFDKDGGEQLYASRKRAERGRVDEDFARNSSVDMPEVVEARIDPNNYQVPERTFNGYSVYAINGVHYIVVRDGDTFTRISRTFGLAERTLRKYNEIDPNSMANPIDGERIYIEQKQSKWHGEGNSHRVKQGETVVSIAQEYGIRAKRLVRINHLKRGAMLAEGAILKLN